MRTAQCLWSIRGIISSPGTTGAIPSHIATVAVASALIRVRELSRSIDFYCSVFEFTVSIREEDAALLLARNGFQIYLHADPTSVQRPIGALGVNEIMWAAQRMESLNEIGTRLRKWYPSTYSHSEGGVSYVDGCDPDGNRVLVAYPSPVQLPRSVIAHRFR
jgi:catechol-2,3-dioxygenase